MIKIFSILLTTLLLFAAQLTFANSAAANSGTAKVAAPSTSMEQTTCPGMDGNPVNKHVYSDFEGKRVYFCCVDCKKKFDADPNVAKAMIKKLEDKGIQLEKIKK